MTNSVSQDGGKAKPEAVDVDWRLTEEQLQAMKEAMTAETAYFQALQRKNHDKGACATATVEGYSLG